MANQSLIVVDNFYVDPYEIRNKALTLTYKAKENASYPGGEATIDGHDWTEQQIKLSKYIDENVEYVGKKNPPFLQGKFRLALAKDQLIRPDLVHEDQQKWSAVIYLTMPEYCKGGIGIYKHKKTGQLSSSHNWFSDVFGEFNNATEKLRQDVKNHFKDPSNWEMIGEIPMLFNRAIILMAHCFHGSTGVFGTDANNGRLTQHFEFYS